MDAAHSTDTRREEDSMTTTVQPANIQHPDTGVCIDVIWDGSEIRWELCCDAEDVYDADAIAETLASLPAPVPCDSADEAERRLTAIEVRYG